MSESPVSKHDAYHLSSEYKETLKNLFLFLAHKLQKAGRKAEGEISIHLGRERVYQAEFGKKPRENKLTDKTMQQIQAALTNPKQLKGTVNIYLGGDKVFQAKDGKVLTDSLQLIPDPQMQEQIIQIQDNFEGAVIEAKGKQVADLADLLLHLVGKTEPDSSVQYTSNYYIFSRKDDNQISVSCKDGRGEILNNNGFTEVADSQDYELLSQIEDYIDNLQIDSPQVKPGLRMRA
jgi:hypothetical protein